MLFFVFLIIIAFYNPVVLGVNASSVFAISLLGNGIRYVVLGNRNINNHTVLSVVFVLFYIILFYYCINSLDVDKSIYVYAKFFLPVIVYAYLCGSFYKLNYSMMLSLFFQNTCVANLLACIVGMVFWYFNIDVNMNEYEGALGSVNGEVGYRMKGTFDHANAFAGFLAMTFPGVIYRLYKFKKIYYWMLLVGNLFCFYQSHSRWSIIAVVASFLMMLIVYTCQEKKIKISYIALGVCILIALAVCMGYLFLSGYFVHEGSNLERAIALQIAFQYAINNDLFGHGLGMGISGLPIEIILDGTIINLLVDIGIIGLVTYLLAICLTFKELLSKVSVSNSFARYMILWSFLIFFIISINESILYNALLNYFLAIYLFFANANEVSQK